MDIKEYCKKQFDDVKSNYKIIYKKWWFWLIIVIIVLCLPEYTPKTTVNSTNKNSNIHISNESNNNIVKTEEELKENEESQKQKEYEKALKERQKRIDDNSLNAYVYTEKLVKDNLKAPSTAKFSNQKYGYNEEYSRYVISGSVDSQNSFGAMIRADFYAEYDQDLEIIYFVFDNEVILDKR